MTTKDKFTDNIINSTLESLKNEHGWSEELLDRIMQLYRSNNLSNIKTLSNAFEEVAASKEDKADD